MNRTKQYWSMLGLAIFFGLFGLILDVSLFFFPMGIILAWLLVLEFLFRSQVDSISDTVTVSYELSQNTVQTDQPVSVTIEVQNIADLRPQLTLSANYPDSAVCNQSSPSKTLVTESDVDRLKSDCHFPFAGTYTLGPASLSMESRYGFFSATLTPSETATVTVEPEATSSIQIGTDGYQFAMGLGDHGVENAGRGLEPADVRTYMPGDPASRINWKATARLEEVYVREFDIETVRPLVVLLDRRQSSQKTLYENPVEYRRNIAISLVREAETHSDPVGLYDVNTSQIEASQRLSADPNQYIQIRRQLYNTVSENDSAHSTKPTQTVQSALNTGRAITQLHTDQSAFGTKLSPFLRGSATTTHQVEDEPLRQTAQTYLKRHGENVRVAILSDDHRRSELYETAKLAGQLSQEVIIFITPSVLFESEDIAAIDNVYTRYSGFERYRSKLDTLENVTAFEVTPGSKLQSVIEQNGNHS